jgi:hypothetical protein
MGYRTRHEPLLQETADDRDADQAQACGLQDTKETADLEDDLNAQTDDLLMLRIRNCEGRNAYGLIGGLTGVGVYFLERLPRGRAAEGIELIVDRLDQMAEWYGHQVTWFSPAANLPEWQRKLCPEGYYNLGVAHGIPAIIHFLSEVQRRGIAERRCLRQFDTSR